MSIVIQSYGGDGDGADLVGYYFDLVPNSTTQYYFYDSSGNQVTTDPSPFTNGEKFTFSLASYDWEIKDYDLTSSPPGGKWKNNHKPSTADDGDGESGSFTAQAGGTIDPEEAASSATV